MFLREETRIETFKNCFSYNARPRDLAKAGFIYMGYDDKVACVFGNCHIWNWKGNDPMEAHNKYFPYCPFVRGCDVGNIHVNYDPIPGHKIIFVPDTVDVVMTDG